MKFLRLIMEDWELKSAASLAYMQAITDLCDFRKCHGVADSTLRRFAVTEVYLRRSRSTLQRKKNLEYSRNLDLESLIARDSWASLEEMEKVIPYHSPKYQYVVKKAKSSGDPPTVSELAFATRFIIAFMFLRVKCTRPMSVQFLTTEMMELAKTHGGFVDQTQFKTSDVSSVKQGQTYRKYKHDFKKTLRFKKHCVFSIGYIRCLFIHVQYLQGILDVHLESCFVKSSFPQFKIHLTKNSIF